MPIITRREELTTVLVGNRYNPEVEERKKGNNSFRNIESDGFFGSMSSSEDLLYYIIPLPNSE